MMHHACKEWDHKKIIHAHTGIRKIPTFAACANSKKRTMAARTTGGGRGALHAGIPPARSADNPCPCGPPPSPRKPSGTITNLASAASASSSGSAASSPGASASCFRGIGSNPRAVERQLVVRLVVNERGTSSHLRLILLPNGCARGSRQATSGPCARRLSSSAWRGLGERFTAGSGEAAHLFRRLRARTLKMVSVKRGRAGRLDVGWLPISSALDPPASGARR
eukprot:4975108-Prymnesium_polylepis.1